jgi:hypothetical protein
MGLGEHLGFAGLAVTLVGLGVTLLWSAKRLIGWVALGLGVLICCVWALTAHRQQPSSVGFATPSTPQKESNSATKVSTNSQGVVIGRDNNNSPITINPAPHSQPCRHPSHGIERYGRILPPSVITSEEMGGGHSKEEWCTKAIQSLAGSYPDGRFTVVSSGDSVKNHCVIVNCPQYTYTCTIQVEADPVYKSAVGPECP